MKKHLLICASAAALLGSASAMAAPLSFNEAGFAKMDQSVNTNANLGKDVGFNGATTLDFFWSPGDEIDWEYAYDGTDVTFTWGGVTVTKAATLAGTVVGFDGYVRNTSKNGLPQDLTLTVDIDAVGSTDLGPITANLGDNFVGFSISEAVGTTWSVTGTAVADWSGAIGTSPNSRLAFQIDALVDDAVAVSEPGTLALLGLGLAGLGLRSRRKR